MNIKFITIAMTIPVWCGTVGSAMGRTFGCDVCEQVYNNAGTTTSSITAYLSTCLSWGKNSYDSSLGWTSTSGVNSGYESCVVYTQDFATLIVACKTAGKTAAQCCYEMSAEHENISYNSSNKSVCTCSYTVNDSTYANYCPNGNCADGVKMTSNENSYCPAVYGCVCNDKYYPNQQSTNYYLGYEVCDCKSYCSPGAYWTGSACALCPASKYKTVAGNATSCPSTCPTPGTTSGSSAMYFDAITDCYVTGGSDETGTYTYTSNCYYTN